MKYNLNLFVDKIRIFGQNFVKNNKDKYLIIYEDKIFPLKEYFSTLRRKYNK